MPRLIFEKLGSAVYMSHLDLMRLFQRAFKRAGLPLTHTQGFNPRPSVSIALPLSVGVESMCELLEFDLDGESVSCEEIARRLNAVLVPGVRVLDAYSQGDKIKNLAYLDCEIRLEYDNGITGHGVDAIGSLFRQPTLIVEKKSKNGITQQDIIPMIRSLNIQRADDQALVLTARICCQNPTLNPSQFHAAIEKYLPKWKPDFVRCRRLEIYDTKQKQFR